jgi:hypothetical protein
VVRFGAMTTGQYFVIRMTDLGRQLGLEVREPLSYQEARDRGIRRDVRAKSNTLYAVDGPTYPNERGAMVTEHHLCHKA